jgi:hypothetical protein
VPLDVSETGVFADWYADQRSCHLGVLTATVPGELIDDVLVDTGRQSRRYRQLPARLMVYYVMALALYAQASYGEVLRCLLEGLRWLRLKGLDQALVSKSAITRARIAYVNELRVLRSFVCTRWD